MAEPEVVPSGTEQASAAQPPALTTPEIQALVAAEAQRIVDARIPGLQSVYEKQIASLRRELKKAQADPDGYVSSDNSELEAQLAQARREADALRAGRSYPNAFPLYEALMSASNVEEQLEILEGWKSTAPPAPQVTAQAPQAPAPVAPPVDRNTPLEPPSGAGGQMTRELAEGILARVGDRWPRFGG